MLHYTTLQPFGVTFQAVMGTYVLLNKTKNIKLHRKRQNNEMQRRNDNINFLLGLPIIWSYNIYIVVILIMLTRLGLKDTLKFRAI